jgi:hypothetical protein
VLTEVLVALVIAALGLATLLDRIDIGSHAAERAEQDRVAAILAESRLAELGHSEPLADGTEQGDFPDGRHWRMVVAPLHAVNGGQSQVLEGHLVTIEVSWLDNGRERRRQFQTLRIGPTP